MSVNRIIKAAQEMREAAQYWKSPAKIDAEYASWPKNRAAAQRFLDALKAWDDLIDELPKFDDGNPYIVGVHGPAPLPGSKD